MGKKDSIVVYWSPETVYWNMYYPEPEILFDQLVKQRNKYRGNRNFFVCPAFSNKNKKVYIFNFPMNVEYEWDFSDPENKFFKAKDEYSPHVGFSIIRPPTINNSPQIGFNLYYLFFCEEELEATFTSPYFSKPNYIKHASVAPGTFDIGQWFRPYPIEMTFWEEKGTISFNNNEPLFYVEFLTDRPVILKRFSPTEKILEYSKACTMSQDQLARNLPLSERYQRFKASKMNKLILKEIKDNLI